MHKAAAVVFSLMIASSAFGQQKNEFQVFVSNLAVSWTSNDGTHGSAGFGLAYRREFTPRFSTQLAVTTEHHETYDYVVEPNGSFRDVPAQSFHTYPIDLTGRYDFVNDTRWKPYLGGGLRYVAAPNVDTAFGYSNHVGAEIIGGTAFRITPKFGLVLDGKVNFGDHESYDVPFKTSFGLLWRF